LYRRYKAYRSLEKSLASIPSIDEFGVRDPNHSLIKTSITSAREELALLSRRSGFASIEDFKNTIQEYITAFQKETVAIGLDMMFKYDQVLQQEGNSYQDKARTTRLYQELKATEARKNYEQAESNETLANNIQPDPELHRYVAPGEWKMKQEAKRREAEYRARGNAEVNKVARNHPLLAQNDFNREELASSSPEGVRALMLGYIQSRRKDIRKAWNELVQNPGCIYMLDKLLQASRTIQEIQPGSIYDLILVDHAEALRAQQVVSNLLITVLALVVGLFTFGQGTVAIIAATVSVGLGAYAALEEFRRYEVESAQYGAQLLSDDPSLGWVIVAVLGLGIDLAGAASAIKGMATAVKSFNKTSNLAELKKNLQALSQIDEKVRTNVLKAAEAEVSYRAAIRRLFSTGGVLRVSLLGAEQVGGLMVVVYHLARRGVLAFDHFLLELKALNIISDIGKLSPEELTRLKQLFERDKRILGELIEHGKTLDLTDEQVDAFIKQLRSEERLTLQQLKERMGAQGRQTHPETPIHSKGTAVSGKALEGPRVPWRAALGTEAEAIIKAVLARSRSTVESLGELALEVTMKRLGIQPDPRFVARYHGIDSIGVERLPLGERIGVDSERRLVGLEAKGSEVDSKALNTHADGPKQLSWKANKKFAQKMLGKKPKIGKPSNRQGGAYTLGEMELYEAIDLLEGRKRLISTHINVRTGQVRVVERDGFGAIPKTAPEGQHDFVLEGLQEVIEIFKKWHSK